MKKTLFKKLTLAVAAIAATLGLSSCQDRNPGSVMVPGLDVSAVSATFNSVTFTVNAEPAVAVAYICVPQGETMSAKDIFEKGTASGTVKGVFTVKSLNAKTKYTLLVAKRDKTVEGPSKVDFETPDNGGKPATPTSAGIRIEEVTKENVKLEIINGAEADYSYVGIWPEVYMENALFEAVKGGKTREQYLQELVTAYPYMCATTVGRGKSSSMDYLNNFNSENKTSRLWPAADYMVISVGMQGDFEKDGKNGKPCDVTVLSIRTEGYDVLGKPTIIIDTMYSDFIRVRYNFRPGADAACYAIYATKKSEIDEFVSHYDAERGAGQGVAMLKEFVRFADPYVSEHTSQMEYSLTYGFDMDNIDFEMMAVPMDKNLMPGEMARRVDQVRPTPDNQVDGVYEYKLDPNGLGIGATNYWYSVKFGGNCGNVYWRVTNKDVFQKDIERLGQQGYARDLWTQGWGEGRPSNPGHNIEWTSKPSFRWGIDQNMDQIIVATSLNYTGGLSNPKIVVESLKTKAVVYDGSYAPQMKIVVDGGVGKTSVNCRFYVPDGQDPNIPRILRHIILEEGDPILALSDQLFSQMLYKGHKLTPDSPEVIGNEWSVYSIDEIDADNPYDWNWNWTGMKPGTKYVYTWLTEDRDGKFSALDRIKFTTATNNGGANPEVTVDVDKASIGNSESESNKWGAKVKYTPNADVTSYSIVVTDQQVLESYGHSIEPKAALEKGLKEILGISNMSGYIDPSTISAYSLAKGYFGYAVGLSYGAGAKEGKMVYRMFKENGTVGDMVVAETTVSAVQAARMRNMAPLRGLEELKARDTRARMSAAEVEVLPPFAAGEPQAFEEMTPDVRQIKVRSIKDITLDVISGGRHSEK